MNILHISTMYNCGILVGECVIIVWEVLNPE